MMELITIQELSKIGLSQKELLNKFNAQLIKDFERGGLENYLKPLISFNYSDIQQQLVATLSTILAKESSKYKQLLYIIDLPENKSVNPEDTSIISDLIIKRILQKVILKLIYSKK